MTSPQPQVIWFAVIGLASTALYFVLLIGLKPLLPSVILLTAVCYVIAMGFNFLGQGMLTFQVKRLSGGQIGRYLSMHSGALLVNSLAMAALVERLNIHILASQAFVTGCITLATYGLSKTWVYR